MKQPWFKRIGILFVPQSIIGWIIFLIGVIATVYVFIDIDSRSHSVSDTLMNFTFYLIIIGAVYSFIGYLTNRRNR